MFLAIAPIVPCMKTRRNGPLQCLSKRVELGQFIVADPAICHGRLTFKGTRVFVADVLTDVERGLSWDFIVQRWGGGKISKAAVAEAVRLARTALLRQDGATAARVVPGNTEMPSNRSAGPRFSRGTQLSSLSR